MGVRQQTTSYRSLPSLLYRNVMYWMAHANSLLHGQSMTPFLFLLFYCHQHLQPSRSQAVGGGGLPAGGWDCHSFSRHTGFTTVKPDVQGLSWPVYAVGPQVQYTHNWSIIFALLQGEVRVRVSGMYKVVAVIFGKQRPTLQLLVNGTIVMRGGGLPSGMGHHTAARAHASSSDVEQAVCGCSMTDYLLLPCNACLTVVHHPQPGSGRGFLSLQKMCC